MRFAVVLALAAALAVAATAYGRSAASGVPKGFSPQTAAVVGTRDIWIFGAYNVACGSVNPCHALVRSRDGGRHFAVVGAPPVVGGGATMALEFTSARVGFAFETGGQLYFTRDGGNDWRSWSPAGVTDVAVGERDVYAVFTKYRRDEYGHFVPASWHVQRRSASGGNWHVVELPVRFRFPISVAARGRAVWLLGSTGHAPGLVTLRSTDRGRTFAQSDLFCAQNVPGEGGRLVPAGHGVVWAVCPTGDGDASRLSLSEDGGRTFRSFGISLKSGAGIFPSSAHAAVLYRGGASGYLLRTADMGRHWVDDRQTLPFWELYWFDFATRRVGAGLFTTFSHPNRASFWRTTDGGATWHSLPIR
jgi:photosystem II stability/assembly factor-like uncharacterized protein